MKPVYTLMTSRHTTLKIKQSHRQEQQIHRQQNKGSNKQKNKEKGGGGGYSPLCFGRYLMIMVKGVFQSNGILKEFSFQTRQEDLTTAFRCRTLDWGLPTLRSDPVKAVIPDQLPVVRHHCPVGTYIVIVCGIFNASLFPFHQPRKHE